MCMTLTSRPYFDNIYHEILIGPVGKGIADGYVFKLIRAWLRAGIVENDMRSITDRGTPQGGVVSPLLANIDLNDMYRRWGESGTDRRNDAHLIRYCDDFIVLSSKGLEKTTLFIEEMLNDLRLQISRGKTRITTA